MSSNLNCLPDGEIKNSFWAKFKKKKKNHTLTVFLFPGANSQFSLTFEFVLIGLF